VLGAATGRRDVHGLLGGRIVRLLSDAGRLDVGAVAARLRRELSPGTTPVAQGAWVEGLLGGGGLVLAHDPALLGVLDGWIGELPPDGFDALLPVLRRTFATFTVGERRLIGDRLRRPGPPGAGDPGPGWDVDDERARPAVQAAVRLLTGRGAVR